MRKSIIWKLLIIVIELAVLLNIDLLTGEGVKSSNYMAKTNAAYTQDTYRIYDETNAMVQMFMTFLENANYEKAYELLNDSCKVERYQSNFNRFKLEMEDKILSSVKKNKRFEINFNESKSIYQSDDMHAFYEVYVYSPESYQSSSSLNLEDSYYNDRDLLIDVIDTEPYQFKLNISIKEY